MSGLDKESVRRGGTVGWRATSGHWTEGLDKVKGVLLEVCLRKWKDRRVCSSG